MRSAPTLKVTKDLTEQFNNTIAKFKRDAVLIGIPESDGPREEGEINNATILAMAHFGSPANNVPKREVLSTGIRNAQDRISDEFKKAAKGALKTGVSAVETYYERAGIIASNSCKKVITDQEGIAPPADSTLKARQYLTQTGFKGTKALLVTGQLRNAITYVVRTFWGK